MSIIRENIRYWKEFFCQWNLRKGMCERQPWEAKRDEIWTKRTATWQKWWTAILRIISGSSTEMPLQTLETNLSFMHRFPREITAKQNTLVNICRYLLVIHNLIQGEKYQNKKHFGSLPCQDNRNNGVLCFLQVLLTLKPNLLFITEHLFYTGKFFPIPKKFIAPTTRTRPPVFHKVLVVLTNMQNSLVSLLQMLTNIL